MPKNMIGLPQVCGISVDFKVVSTVWERGHF